MGKNMKERIRLICNTVQERASRPIGVLIILIFPKASINLDGPYAEREDDDYNKQCVVH